MKSLEAIRKHKVFAVIRAENAESALDFAEGCIKGGLRLIEITFSFPGAEEAISALSGRLGVLVGAGTVLDIDMAERAKKAGAAFLVSPHTDKDLVTFAKENTLTSIQGAFTSSEIVNAWKMGVDMVKIFPVSAVGGPAYVKAIKDPLPFVEIMTTGGVGLDNFADFIKAGASAVGVSSALLGKGGRIDADAIAENASKFAAKLRDLDKG
ncbi:MAG: bifunctional 4-hydroxy-2-oxoglutarate aldolase/2-dehydro-3-deoxy-phosphogluconate aldolase [Thermodesulfobacteriota bacterium]